MPMRNYYRPLRDVPLLQSATTHCERKAIMSGKIAAALLVLLIASVPACGVVLALAEWVR